MNIEVFTSSEHRAELLENAAKFYARHLNLERSRYTVCIKPTSGLIRRQQSYGIAVPMDRRTIAVFLDSRMSIGRTLHTLAHEMVHVKQIARGQYKQISRGSRAPLRYWRGVRVIARYHKRPWEIEAHTRQDALYEQLIDHVQSKMPTAI